MLEKVPPPEGIVSGADTKDDQLKQEILSLPEGPQNPTIQNGQNYNIGLVSTMLGSQHLQFEGTEPQTHEASRFSNFVVSFKLCCSICHLYIQVFVLFCFFIFFIYLFLCQFVCS